MNEAEISHPQNDIFVPNLGGRTFSRDIPAGHFDPYDMLHSNSNQPPSHDQQRKLTTEQMCRIGTVMLAYALFYTLFAGNQTVSLRFSHVMMCSLLVYMCVCVHQVSSLAAKNLSSTEYATIPTVALFTGAIIVV
jgi:hypothetical protein